MTSAARRRWLAIAIAAAAVVSVGITVVCLSVGGPWAYLSTTGPVPVLSVDDLTPVEQFEVPFRKTGFTRGSNDTGVDGSPPTGVDAEEVKAVRAEFSRIRERLRESADE